MIDTVARAWGIGRSMAMYHAIPGRHARMASFYRQFLSPGDLAFDVGAHVGSRVRSWRRIGAAVVAVEPQPDCLKVLRLLYGRDPAVRIVDQAVGAEAGTAVLAVSVATPTVSTMAPGWIDEVTRDHRFARVRWNRRIDVPVTTLDALITECGEPAFVKIDVEGFEVAVLSGLSRPVPALSFEYLPPAHEDAMAALDLVEHLGRYRYNYSPVETMRFATPDWVDATGLAELLARYRPLGRSGDVYARLAG